MGAKDERNFDQFQQKFDKALSLLNSYCDKPKSSFSENISFLLDKSLDHLIKLDNDSIKETKSLDPTHAALIKSQSVKIFFNEVLKISKVHSIHSSIITFAINLLLQLTNNEVKFELMYSEAPNIFIKIQQLTETTVVENNEIKQSIMNFFLSLSKIKAGLYWLLNSGSLLFVVESLSDRTIFTRKKAEEAINYALPLLDDVNRETIFTKLLEPILKAGNKLENHQIESDKLKPYFEILEHYVTLTLTSNIMDKTGKTLSSLNTEQVLQNIVSSAENEKLLTQAASLIAAIYAKCAMENEKERNAWEIKTIALIQMLLRRGFLRVTLSVISQSLFFWSHVKTSNFLVGQLVYLMVNAMVSINSAITYLIFFFLLAIQIVPVLVDTKEVADHFPCYTTICQYWEDLADNSTKSISQTLSAMLHSNSELNELTSISLIGLNKSINKLGKVSKNSFVRDFRLFTFLFSKLGFCFENYSFWHFSSWLFEGS